MSETTIAMLLKAAELHARATLIGGKGDMIPLCHLVHSDGQEAVIGTPWENDEQKEMTLRMLAALMRSTHVVRYMVMCEAWMRLATAEEAENYKPGDPMPVVKVGEHPDRKEIVIASAIERGDKAVRIWETKRDGAGVCVDLVDITDTTEKWEGDWLKLLPLDA